MQRWSIGQTWQPWLLAAVLFASLVARDISVPPTNPPAAAADPREAPALSPDAAAKLAVRDREAYEKISDAAQKLNEMILLIIGGSLAALLGSTYLHPKNVLRWVYVLFPFGWTALAFSVSHGLEVRATYLAYMVNPYAGIREEWIGKINHELLWQRVCFEYGLGAFAIWLIIYVFWWMAKGGETAGGAVS